MRHSRKTRKKLKNNLVVRKMKERRKTDKHGTSKCMQKKKRPSKMNPRRKNHRNRLLLLPLPHSRP